MLRVDGGAANNDYLMQFQADILNIPIERANNLETTALGVAFLAGLAVGYWENIEELHHVYQSGQTFLPVMDANRRQQLYHGWTKAVKATRLFE